MEEAEVCEGCGERRVLLDAVSGLLCCEACGQVKDETATELDASFQVGHLIERRGTVVHFGDSGERAAARAMGGRLTQMSGNDRKKVDILKKVKHLAGVLRVPSDTVSNVNHMLENATEGEWGMGRWTDILVGACIYVAVRQNHLPLTVVEVADAISCDVKELGRMYNRVLKVLELNLPSEDLFIFFDRAMSSITISCKIEKEEARRLTKQGRVLLEYASRWSITTGRHSLPVVAAVILCVMEANEVKVGIDEVSRELHATVATTRNRYKEFQEALIKVAQRLPWGKDVTTKTVSYHLPFLLQYLEASKRLHKDMDETDRTKRLKVNNTETTSKNIKSGDQKVCDVSAEDCSVRTFQENTQQSSEISSKVKTKVRETVKFLPERQPSPFEILPPAFIASENSRLRRRTKIKMAKMRIAETKRGLSSNSSVSQKQSVLQKTEDGDVSSHALKDFNMAYSDQLCKPKEGLDREDIIIECLLLHGARETQVEEGYYSSLCEQLFYSSGSNLEISDQDLAQYIRSPKEVDLFSELMKHSMTSPWVDE